MTLLDELPPTSRNRHPAGFNHHHAAEPSAGYNSTTQLYRQELEDPVQDLLAPV